MTEFGVNVICRMWSRVGLRSEPVERPIRACISTIINLETQKQTSPSGMNDFGLPWKKFSATVDGRTIWNSGKKKQTK